MKRSSSLIFVFVALLNCSAAFAHEEGGLPPPPTQEVGQCTLELKESLHQCVKGCHDAIPECVVQPPPRQEDFGENIIRRARELCCPKAASDNRNCAGVSEGENEGGQHPGRKPGPGCFENARRAVAMLVRKGLLSSEQAGDLESRLSQVEQECSPAQQEPGEGEGGQENPGDGSEKVTLCHVPPGNPSNAHTISVGASAVDAHLAHGDYLGECKESDDSSDKGNSGKKEKKNKSKNGKSKKSKN